MRPSRKTWALGLGALSGLMALVALASFFLGQQSQDTTTDLLGTGAVTTAADSVLATRYEHGQTLFIGKGCARCHSHAAVGSGLMSELDLTDLGDPSSGLPSDEAYLRSWLRDPQAIRPDTVMPNLDLSDEEIDGLLTFLLAGSSE